MEDGTLMVDVLKPIEVKKEGRKDTKLKAQKPKQAKSEGSNATCTISIIPSLGAEQQDHR